MSDPIILYDIPCYVRGQRVGLSGNILKTRLVLNYKGLPFTTVWLNHPEIEPTCKRVGIPPTGTWPDGAPLYTLPAIHDPKTGQTIAESAAIVRYLDAAYPDTPRCIPAGTEAFHALFEDALGSTVLAALGPLIMPLVPAVLSPEGAEYYRATRLKQLGVKLEDMSPPGSALREQQWKALEAGFAKLAGWMDVGGQRRMCLMGDVVSYADLFLAAQLVSLKWALGEEHEEWKRVAAWDGGRWAAFIEGLEGFAQ